MRRLEGRNHMNGLKRKEEVHERDGSVETKERKYQMDGKSWNERNAVANGREALNERKEVTHRGKEFLTLFDATLWYALRPSACFT